MGRSIWDNIKSKFNVADGKQIESAITEKTMAVTEPMVPLVPTEQDNAHILVLIAAAIAAYGYSPSQISVIRPVGSRAWSQAARYEIVHNRNQMF